MSKKFRVAPTKVQWVMVALMAVFWTSALLWVIPELAGVFSEAAEDTYSEWVFDLPLRFVLIIVALHIIGGILLIWSAGHFLEGYGRRRRIERGGKVEG